MHILADQDIPAVRECFAGMGELRLFGGRELRRADLGSAEVLLVRSVTPVSAPLIVGSQVRFVGTATAGVDHVDTDALAAAGIAFSDAAGCNARAVAEHVVTCLYHYAARRQCHVRRLTVGIIGHGHVGSALATLLGRLGIASVSHDPPRAARLPAWTSAALEQVLACDVVTLHVPLVSAGRWPTVNLFDAAAIAALRPGALVINAARGGVLDETALVARLVGADRVYAAIDCWSNEPVINLDLARRAWFATPHIAGYTREARLQATRLLHAAVRRWSGQGSASAPAPALPSMPLRPHGQGADITDMLCTLHPLAAHDARLRAVLGLPAAARGAHFDDVRRRFGMRREFGAYSVACVGRAPDTVAELTALGLRCVTDASD